ncbi:hypothetical protein ANCCEY_03831 [Ancylostoma ceylanicum]|uniref:Uncharacterized protein n=1 Tax=Ancylostoma ceylanicum TaxID=53326 RepID=A0A0D6LYD1_9BILA|nr:hypothetical protein ANCCEY_03831 [Ancylostoma ceylanicum]
MVSDPLLSVNLIPRKIIELVNGEDDGAGPRLLWEREKFLARPDESIVTGLQSAGQSSLSWAENAVKDVGHFLSNASKDVGHTAEQAWNTTKEKAGELGNTLKGAAGNVAEHGEQMAGEVKNWAEGAVDTVKRGGESAVNVSVDAFQGVRQGVEQGAHEGAKAVGDVVQGQEGGLYRFQVPLAQ